MSTRRISRYIRKIAPVGVLAAALVAGPALAADFTGYTTEELLQMRQENQISTEDREAFRSELRSRMQAMTPEERSSMQQEYGFGRGSGQGGDGQGMGRGRGRGQGDAAAMDGGSRGGRGRGRGRWR